MYVNLNNNLGFQWQMYGPSKYKHGLSREELEKIKKICVYLGRPKTDIDLCELKENLRQINGSFAFVFENENYIVAVTDRLRSIPLFYGLNECGKLNEISDSLYLLEEDDGEPLAWKEIEYTGYTFNERTLRNGYSQMMAGQILIYDKFQENHQVDYYYRHLRQPNDISAKLETEFDKLFTITENLIDRLIDSVGNKKIVIPLSGGYDSRYIVAALFKRGFRNLLCYSYGHPQSYEILNARKVADTLGIEFIEIYYNDDDWRKLLESSRFEAYCRYSANASSLPHVQEFIALEYLQENALIPGNSVIVPGFCGDLLGGSYLPKEYLDGNSYLAVEEDIADYIIRNHLVNRKSQVDLYDQMLMRSDVQLFVGKIGIEIASVDDFICVNECWFTEHKVAKFVVNALRVYEYYGYEWRMPLWDNELVEYWYKIPNGHRIDNAMYNKFLFDRFFIPLEIDMPKKLPMSRNPGILTLRKYIPAIVFSVAGSVYRKIRSSIESDDINKFDALSTAILDRIGEKTDDYANVNGALAQWLKRQKTLQVKENHAREAE